MRKENIFINFLLSLIAFVLIIVILFFGYIVYEEYYGEGTIIIDGEAGYPVIGNNNATGSNVEDTEIVNIDLSTTDTQTNDNKNRYLYNQLSDTAKIIYQKLYDNKENLKTGTYTLEFGNVFSNILSQENGSDLLKQEYQTAIEAFTYENPDVFYLDVTKMYINIEMIKKLFTTKYNVYINNYEDPNYLAESFTSKDQIDECQRQIEQVRDKVLANIEGKDIIEQIRYIHNYLIDNVQYDQTVQKDNIYNIYGALVLKEGVCEGYAKALQYLLSSAGIENVIVTGIATNNNGETENHAWNYVKIGSAWYALDVTWDDPIIIGGGKINDKIRYQYFLKGSRTMDENHYLSNQFTENGMEFEFPKLSITDYNI